MHYQGYKLVDKIILVGKVPRKDEKYMQAFLVDPANKNQLENAKRWATWTEYGPYDRETRTYEWKVEHDAIEFEFDNTGFKLELLDCAGGSSQGGKLSFWNCLVSKDEHVFKIGINSDMLLDLLKSATFINGKCQSDLVFITCKGKVGLTVVGSDSYKQCLKDREFKNSVKTKATTKYSFGDKIDTTTLQEIYLGKLTKYYKFDFGDQDRYCLRRYFDPRKCTLTKLAEPVEYQLIESQSSYKHYNKISEIINQYKASLYSYPTLLDKRPKRVTSGSLELDITEEEFYKQLLAKWYDLEGYIEERSKNSWCSDHSPEYTLSLFLDRSMFGFGTEPFELDEELMKKIKAAGIKYVEE